MMKTGAGRLRLALIAALILGTSLGMASLIAYRLNGEPGAATSSWLLTAGAVLVGLASVMEGLRTQRSLFNKSVLFGLGFTFSAVTSAPVLMDNAATRTGLSVLGVTIMMVSVFWPRQRAAAP